MPSQSKLVTFIARFELDAVEPLTDKKRLIKSPA